MPKTRVSSVCMALALLAAFAGAALAAEPAFKSVTAIAESLEQSQTVVGVRIEFPAEVKAEDIKFNRTFRVTGYDIVGTYVNNDGEWDNARPKGRYVFLKFAINQVPASMYQGKTLISYKGLNSRQPINLDIRQLQEVKMADGQVMTPRDFTNNAEINLLVDDFLDLAFTDSTGFEIKYRLFVPEGYEAKKDGLDALPLVVFYHGGGETGPDGNNIVHLTANPSALEFAKPEAQEKHPCFVLAPQSRTTVATGGLWATNVGTKEQPLFGMTQSLKAALELIKELNGKYNIDANRIYGTGLSQGSRGTFISSMIHPDLYAAQLNIASSDVYTDDQAKALVNKPIWTVVAADEVPRRLEPLTAFLDQLERLGAKQCRWTGDKALDGFIRGPRAAKAAKAQWDEAKANGQWQLVTHLVAGTVIDDSHRSWRWTYSNEAIRDWLFSQSKK